jgi:hypothetical protein
MNKTLLATMLALGITVVSTTAMAFDLAGATARQGRGADDNVPGNIHQCRGCDDPVGHIRQGRGADDVGGMRGVHADGHISGRDRVRPIGSSSGHGRGRGHGIGGMDGGNSGRGHGIGAVGTTNPAGHVRGRGADDVGGARGIHADGHISGRDRVGISSMGALGLLGR